MGALFCMAQLKVEVGLQFCYKIPTGESWGPCVYSEVECVSRL